MIEIRSFRRVFDLERRIYRVDRLRLNPSGIPVRGVVYLLVLIAVSLGLAALPPFVLLARRVPWFLVDLAFPGMLAALLAVVRIDGRPFHLAARALLRLRSGRRHLVGLRPLRLYGELSLGSRWRPDPIAMLPDGSDSKMRRFRFTGPGALLITVAHEHRAARRSGLRRPLIPDVVVREVPEVSRPARGEVILLERAARLSVR